MFKVPADVIVQLQTQGRWVIYNVFSRTCLGADHTVLELLGDIAGIPDSELKKKYGERKFHIWEIWRFSNYDGLLADPTRLIRDTIDWPQVQVLGLDDITARLKKYFLIIEDEEVYRARFALKKSLVDAEHFGNFHQQMGQELMVFHRKFSAQWWPTQKFTEDFSAIKNNLYGAVQENYLKSYFPRRFNRGSTVIDIGCGIGYYANMMAKTGANVLGVDPNKDYIELARQRAVNAARFEVMDIGVPGGLDKIPSSSADFIFMSDALLFYFVPESPNQKADIQILLADIRRILKPDGRFISMEPHYIFWLLPWWGEPEHPFTVLTEYTHKNFHVTPTISQFIQAFSKGRLAVTWMDEILPKDDFKETDPRAYHFAREFPLWHIIEFKPF